MPELLREGYRVRVLDNLTYGGSGLLNNFIQPNFEFVHGSVLDNNLLKTCLKDVDFIIHLAALVGYPACKKNPDLARAVNVQAVKLLASLADPNQRVLFSSTVSCYGENLTGVCTEESPLNPISLYAETKAQSEEVIRQMPGSVICRFATAFGLSPRMRLDLLINDFVYQAVRYKQLIVYERHFMRGFIHVRDFASFIIYCIKDFERVKGETYNVGSEALNLTKEQLALKINEKVKFFLHFADVGHDEDRRNYTISYEKLHKLGFRTAIGLDEGLEELIRGVQTIEVGNPYSNI